MSEKMGMIDVLQCIGIVVSMVFSGYALISAEKTNSTMQCFQEKVPISIAALSNYESIRQSFLSEKTKYLKMAIDMQSKLKLSGYDQSGPIPNEILIGFVDLVSIASLSLLNLETNFAPYLSEQEKAELKKITKVVEIDTMNKSDDEKIAELTKLYADYDRAFVDAVKFIHTKVSDEAKKDFMKLCS